MNYLLHLWDIFTWTVMPFAFLSTIRLSLQGMVKLPDSRIVRVLTHEGWCISIITVLPWYISEFARGGLSPVPWRVFSEISAMHGAAEGGITMLIVCIVDMWLLWTPAQIYACRIHPSDRQTVKFVRIINGLAGLLLFTPGNPFFQLAQLL
jgi:hypothetical protein